MIVPLDVRYGFRKLNNSVGFTVVAVACLALGICASITVFSVVLSAETVAEPLLLLALVTALLMLVVCTNLGGLLMVRTAARQEEIGIRLALGGTRSRLVRQLLTESVALSLLGGGVGFLLALFALDAVQGLSLGRSLPTIRHVAVGLRGVAFTVGLSLGSGVLFGLVPALWSTRQVVPMLHRRGEGAQERGRTRLQEILVVGQVTVSLMLLVCTGLFVRTLQNLRAVDPRLLSWLFVSFSLTALLVTAIGLYGTLSYAVSRRTRELGIRMALGARASEIITLVLRRGLALTLTGLVLGLVAASWATSLCARFLFGVAPTDPGVFVAVALLLGLVGLAASSLPAYRATRIDPMTIIRHE